MKRHVILKRALVSVLTVVLTVNSVPLEYAYASEADEVQIEENAIVSGGDNDMPDLKDEEIDKEEAFVPEELYEKEIPDGTNTFIEIDETKSETIVASGTCGESIAWELDSEGVLNISGTGNMTDYANQNYVPWADKKSQIKVINISAGVTSIGNYAFQGLEYLTSVSIPEGITGIGRNAFQNCYILEAVTLPQTLESIGQSAFEYTNLNSIVIPNSVTSMGTYAFKECHELTSVTWSTGLNTIPNYTFQRDSKLESIVIPSNVTQIGECAFSNCTALENVKFETKNPTIGSFCFEYCTSLQNITLPTELTNLGAYSFYKCTGLEKVVFPSTLKKIQSEAFSHCSMLNNVILPDGLETMEQGVFAWNDSLEKITIPSSVTSFSYDMFYQCYSLKEAYINANITELPRNTFYECTSLEKVTLPGGLKKISNDAFRKTNLVSLTIPSTVESIGDNVFYGSSLTSLVIPDTVTYLGSGVLRECTNLKTVTLPSNITTIKDSFFSGCSSLTDVTIPAGVTTLGNYAFYGCKSLTGLTIPDLVSQIGSSTFSGADSLDTLIVSEENETFEFENGILYNKTDNSVVLTAMGYTGKFTPREGITYISSAMVPKKISSVVIPASVTEIRYDAFKDCTNLVSVTYAEGTQLNTINSGAFSGCTKLKSIWIPASARLYGGSIFYNCTSLSKVEFESGNVTTSIEYNTFGNCKSLKSITIPAAVTSFSTGAFAGCSALEEINVEEGSTKYESIDGILCDLDGNVIYKPEANTGSAEYKLREGMTTVKANGFKDRTDLTTVTIPSTVESIQQNAFYGCTNLKTIKFAKGSKLKTIGSYAFYGCSSLKEINLPEGVTVIDESAFAQNTALTSISIPSTVKTIGKNAFYNDIRLTEIILPDSLTEIGEYAFDYCTGLVNMTIPEGVTTLNRYVFNRCTSLETLNLPASLSGFDITAINGCSSLKEINVAEDSEYFVSVNGMLFDKITNEILFYPSAGQGDVVIPEGVINLDDSIFAGDQNITSVTLPSSLETISSGVFDGCTALKTVIFEEGCQLTEIPDYAFDGCTDLNTIIFKGTTNVSNIGSYAFNGCTDLVGVYFEDNSTAVTLSEMAFYNCYRLKGIFNGSENAKLSNIGRSAFENAYALEAVAFSDECSQIGTRAFWSCTSLKNIVLPKGINSIGVVAFYKCNALEGYRVDEENETYTSVDGVLYTKDMTRLVCFPQKKGSIYEIPEGVETIGDCSFAGAIALEKVITPSTLTNIEKEAFSGCDKLTDVDLRKSTELESLGNYVFYYCPNLVKVDFGENDSLTYIGSYAFYKDAALVDMMLPDSVETLSAFVFYNCNKWVNGTIPASATSIGESAYYYCRGLKEIIIPKNVTIIDDSAFEECSGVTRVSFEEGSQLKYINYDAFENVQMETLEIPEGVIYIGSHAFRKCTRLREITFPSTLTTLGLGSLTSGGTTRTGSFMLSFCDDLQKVVFNSGELEFKAYTVHECGNNVTIWSYEDSTAKTYAENNGFEFKVIGVDEEQNNITIIGSGETDDGTIQWELTSDGVLTVSGSGAVPVDFASDYDLSDTYEKYVRKIIVEEGITSLGNYSFYSLDYLREISLPSTLTEIGEEAFYSCDELKSVYIPANVITIQSYAFEYTGLEEVTFAENSKLEELGYEAFYQCDKLKSITLPGGLKSIGNRCFAECDSLEVIAMEEGNEEYEIYAGCLYHGDELMVVPAIKGQVHIKDGTKEIWSVAFINPEFITEIFIPSSVNYIEELGYVFSNSNVKAIHVDADNMYYEVYDDVLYSVENNLLVWCPTRKAGVCSIKEGTETIGAYGFSDCTNITEVIIPEGVQTIEKYAFKNCSSLIKLKLPNTTSEIGEGAFYGCSSLIEMIIPEGVHRIRDYTFKYCSNLEKLYLSENINDIYGYLYNYHGYYDYSTPFDYCNRLVIYADNIQYMKEYAAKYKQTKTVGSSNQYVTLNIEYGDTRKYYIDYKINELEGEKNDAANPSSYRCSDGIVRLKDAAKDGYIFAGWYTDSQFRHRIKVIAPDFAKNYTLYPLFKKIFTVTALSDGEEYFSVEVGEGDALSSELTEVPEKEGYKFACWLDENGNAYDPGSPVEGDMILTACWQTVEETTIYPVTANWKSGTVNEDSRIVLACDTLDTRIYYTLDGTDPWDEGALEYMDSIILDKALIEQYVNEDGEIILKVVACRMQGDGPEEMNVYGKASAYTYKINYSSRWGSILSKDRNSIGDSDLIPEGMWFKGIPVTTTYTGEAQKFDIRVYDGKTLLTEGVDYTVSYKNNKNAAGADAGSKAPAVIIKGKGNYTDTITKNFTILPVTITDSYIYIPSVEYNGKVQKPKPAIVEAYTSFVRTYEDSTEETSDNWLPLKSSDYKMTYSTANGGCKNVGTYTVDFEGKGNFTGVTQADFTILEKGSITKPVSIKKAKIEGFVKSMTYDENSEFYSSYGGFTQANLKLTYTAGSGSNKVTRTLYKNSDYYITYQKNTKIGTATMIITGMGQFKGTVKKTFKITGTSMKKAKVQDFTKEFTYTGKPCYQTDAYLELTTKVNGNTTTTRLVQGIDYNVSYKNNIKAGTATVTYKGIGKYTGTIKKTFKIKAYNIKDDLELKTPALLVEYNQSEAYVLGGVKPKVVVSYKGVELVSGKDYKISYKNNTKPALSTDSKAPSFTIKGTKNFTGSITYTFDIVKQDIGELSASAPDVSYKAAGTAYVSKMTIKDVNGKTLKAGTNYDSKLVYSYDSYTKLENGTIRRVGDTVQDTDIVPAGTIIRVTASGRGNYTGEISTTYRVTDFNIGKAKAKVNVSFTYSGTETVLTRDMIEVTIGGTTLSSTDFEIVAFKNNVNSGTAQVTIRGIGNYGGELSTKFTIKKKSVK